MSEKDILERLWSRYEDLERIGVFDRHFATAIEAEDFIDAIDEIERLRGENEKGPEKAHLTLSRLQEEQRPWVKHNFGDRAWQQPLMGISEEVGELNHALLKQWQGIRGTKEDLEREAQDAVGDIVIFISDLCSSRGWDFQEIVEATWSAVQKRDWKADSQNGGE